MRVGAVFFVASPLNYMAARRIAQDFEPGARRVVVGYRTMALDMIDPADWDAVLRIGWPRLEPMPGRFGRVRRLLDNLEQVAAAVGPCDELHLHSPVFEPEAINYFLHALPVMTGAHRLLARLLPDGTGSLRRYPMSFGRHLVQWTRGLRRLFDGRLVYSRFGGDRMGSDAPFVDRIYVLDGFPHPYPTAKVRMLPPLVQRKAVDASAGAPRALVLGQPLASAGFMGEADRKAVADAMAAWLAGQGLTEVWYKAHPREPAQREFMQPHYRELLLDGPLESHLGEQGYAAVCGCSSTALVTARQLQGGACRIASFGLERLNERSNVDRATLRELMQAFQVELLPASLPTARLPD
jgi:hypothetical protein